MTHKDMFKGIGYKSLDKQHGGSHYKKFKIQPAEFINENKLLFAEGKEEDIKKAIHYLEMILERDYNV